MASISAGLLSECTLNPAWCHLAMHSSVQVSPTSVPSGSGRLTLAGIEVIRFIQLSSYWSLVGHDRQRRTVTRFASDLHPQRGRGARASRMLHDFLIFY